MPVDGPQYPANLVLQGRRVLVVGAGAVAARKVNGLLACEADVVVVAPVVGEAVRTLAEAGSVQLHERAYQASDLDDAWLAVTATDDPAVNRQVFLDGEAAGVWVNSADDPANCAFTLPAVVRQGPITVAIGTGGHSPALATWLRRHVERELDATFTTLLDLLAERRVALREGGTPTEGLSWQQVLDSGMLELVRQGRLDEARERLATCL